MNSSSTLTCRHLLFILDWRSSDEIIFYTLRDTLVQQCINLFHVFHISSQYEEGTVPLFVSLKILLRNNVEVLLDRINLSATPTEARLGRSSSLHSLVVQTFEELLQKPCVMIPPTDTLRASLPLRLQPLTLAFTHSKAETNNKERASETTEPHPGGFVRDDTLIFITSSFLSYADLFASLSLLTRLTEKGRSESIREQRDHSSPFSNHNSSPPHAFSVYRIHCLGVDADAACITMAEFNGTLPSSGSTSVKIENTTSKLSVKQRLYRSAGDPCDIRFAIQSSVSPFLLGESTIITVQMNLGGHFKLVGLARRPYLVDLHRCCLPEDLHESHVGHRPGLCFLGHHIGSSPFSIAREQATPVSIPGAERHGFPDYHGKAEHRAVGGNDSVFCGRVPQLHLQALLHPEMVEETHLFGDPWILTPSPQDSIWQSVFDVFQQDVFLLRTNDPFLQGLHRLASPHACFVAFFKDKWHIILRQVIPTELRREIITRGDESVGEGKRGGLQDPILLEELQDLRQHIRGENQSLSTDSMNEILSCGLGLISSQVTIEAGVSLCVNQKV